ncbi:MAG: Na+/H+ antiporter subunit E [Phycisphaerales bacterium]
MSLLATNTILALVWALAIGPFTPANLLTGFIIGYVALAIAWRGSGRDAYFKKVWTVIAFLLWFSWELIVSNLRMAYYTIAPLSAMRPGILAIELDDDLTDAEITTLANLITLTPGTLSLDVSTDRRALFIHLMDVRDPDRSRSDLRDGFQRRVKELMR